MPTKNKCENCKWFKKHTLFGEKCVEITGGDCEITGKHTKCIVANKVVTFDLERQCPLQKMEQHDKLRDRWSKLRMFVINLQKDTSALEKQSKKLLRDVALKINELEKGEN